MNDKLNRRLYDKLSRIIKEESGLPAEVQAVINEEKIFGRYVKLLQLSSGTMGDVWKCYDIKLNRYVAVKIQNSIDPVLVDRFLKEAQIAAKLNHPNIVKIYDYGTYSKSHYLVMDYIEGFTVDRSGSQKDRLERICKVAEILDYCHSNKVIHRDIKPQNIMVNIDNEVILVDFGLAKDTEAFKSILTLGNSVGTPAYMSPEQAKGEEIDKLTDIYSLGASLYHLVTNKLPFDGNSLAEITNKIINEDPIHPTKINKNLHKDVGTIINKAMSKDKKKRYQSAGEFAQDIKRFLQGTSILAKPPGVTTSIIAFARRRLALVVSVVAFLLLILCVGIYLHFANQKIESRNVQNDISRRKKAVVMSADAFVNASKNFNDPFSLLLANQDTLWTEFDKHLLKFDEALKLHSNEAKVYFYKAKAYHLGGDYQTAEKDFAKALELDPNYYPALVDLSQLYLSKAIEKFIYLLILEEKISPKITFALKEYAHKIEECIRQINVSDKKDQIYDRMNLIAHILNNDFSAGLELCDTLYKKNNDEYILLLKQFLFILQRNLSEAQKVGVNKAVFMDYYAFNLHAVHKVIYILDSQPLWIAEIESTLRPDYSCFNRTSSLYMLGIYGRIKSNNKEGALSLALKAAANMPKNYYLKYLLGDAYFLNDKYNEAIDEYTKAINPDTKKEAPLYSNALYKRALSYLKLQPQKTEAARKDLIEAKNHSDPKWPYFDKITGQLDSLGK